MPTPTLATLAVGAPGIYRVADSPIRALTGVRMDVCAFVGVAPRGPARDPFFFRDWAPQPASEGQTEQLATPVAVESWSAYTRLFGAFEGPGLLPYAVASFFDNGGSRAYIVRVVHRYYKPDGTDDEVGNGGGFARAPIDGLTASGGRAVWVRASNEGAWGNGLAVRLSFVARTLGLAASDFFPDRLRLPTGTAVVAGATLQLMLGGGAKVIRRVTTIVEDWNPLDGTRQTWAYFDAPTAGAAVAGNVVEGLLAIDDGVNPTETHEHVGLSSEHPRWLAAVIVERLRPALPVRRPRPPAGRSARVVDRRRPRRRRGARAGRDHRVFRRRQPLQGHRRR